jgi:hypothetical protein
VFLSNQDKALSLRSVNYIIEGVARRAGIENPNPRLEMQEVAARKLGE